MENAYANKKVSTGGQSFKVNKNKNTSSIPCPQKYIDVFNEVSNSSIDFADKYEIKYFNEYKLKVSNFSDKGWSGLSKQEQKVITGLDPYKIPAYLGYRNSFGLGIHREGYKNKPIFALIEVASSCNIKCPFCFQSDSTFTTKEYMGIIDKDLAFRVINEIDDLMIRGITIASRGEPLLCKDLGEILHHIGTKKNILEVKINTNAKRLNEKNLKMLVTSPVNILVISTDHYEKELYEKYRHGSSYENFINNISQINSVREKNNRTNTLYTRASGVKVDEAMDIEKYDSFYLNYFDESGTTRMSERWNTYANEVDTNDLRPCGLPFERIYIWFDGVTNPCDSDYKSYLTPGNVKEKSLKECWDNLAKLRNDMLTQKRKENTPCDRCYVA